jgi:5-methylcytosine-specific restriction endonuclease McrA
MPQPKPWMHLYHSKQWHSLRVRQLKASPLCVMCGQLGNTVAATVVDHIKPHRGDESLFFNPANLQSLCKRCHDSAKQTLERSGVLIGCGADGTPLDPNHHWK